MLIFSKALPAPKASSITTSTAFLWEAEEGDPFPLSHLQQLSPLILILFFLILVLPSSVASPLQPHPLIPLFLLWISSPFPVSSFHSLPLIVSFSLPPTYTSNSPHLAFSLHPLFPSLFFVLGYCLPPSLLSSPQVPSLCGDSRWAQRSVFFVRAMLRGLRLLCSLFQQQIPQKNHPLHTHTHTQNSTAVCIQQCSDHSS